jgi:hypothetical protein
MDYETGLVDLSPSAHTFIIDGVSQSTVQAMFGTHSLLVSTVGGDSNNLRQADTNYADWQFSNLQFTIECWVYLAATPPASQPYISQWGVSSDWGWYLGTISNNLYFYYQTTNGIGNLPSSATISLNTWHHVCVDRDASLNLRLYLDGVVLGITGLPYGMYASSQQLYIGNQIGSSVSVPGYIDEVRITKGTARYGGAFTPPTAPFPIG